MTTTNWDLPNDFRNGLMMCIATNSKGSFTAKSCIGRQCFSKSIFWRTWDRLSPLSKCPLPYKVNDIFKELIRTSAFTRRFRQCRIVPVI